jgi:integrase
VTSYKGKAKNVRTVPWSTTLREALLDLQAKPSPSAFRKLRNGERPDSTLVFGIVSNIKRSFDGPEREAGLNDLTFHDTRHCAGSALSKGGMSLALVGKILGHSDRRPRTAT